MGMATGLSPALGDPRACGVRFVGGQVKPVRRPKRLRRLRCAHPRAAEISADIYQLIVREIPQLRGDGRVLALLEASVGET
jgi:hypothetical protein